MLNIFKHYTSYIIICLCTLCALPSATASNTATTIAADKNITLGIYGSDRKAVINRKFLPLVKYIEKHLREKTGEPFKIKLVYYDTYEDGINAIVNGEVDIARLGPVSYVKAKDKNPDLSIVAIEANNGKKSFQGVICVKKDSNIYSLEDIKGKTFAFGNRHSTSGRYLAQKHLYTHGIKASHLAEHTYFSKHGDVAFSLVQSEYDAGSFKDVILKNRLLARSLRVVSTFPVITHPWVANSNISPSTKNSLTDVLLNIKNKKVFDGLKRNGFLAGDDSEYEDIRDAINMNHLFYN